jgi:hypothetical protein
MSPKTLTPPDSRKESRDLISQDIDGLSVHAGVRNELRQIDWNGA